MPTETVQPARLERRYLNAPLLRGQSKAVPATRPALGTGHQGPFIHAARHTRPDSGAKAWLHSTHTLAGRKGANRQGAAHSAEFAYHVHGIRWINTDANSRAASRRNSARLCTFKSYGVQLRAVSPLNRAPWCVSPPVCARVCRPAPSCPGRPCGRAPRPCRSRLPCRPARTCTAPSPSAPRVS